MAMVLTKQYVFCSLSLMVMLIAACGKEDVTENTGDQSDTTKSDQTESGNNEGRGDPSASSGGVGVVYMRGNSEAEFQGIRTSNLKELPIEVARKLFEGGRKEDLSLPLALSADQETSFGHLKKALGAFQLFGFRNLMFRCGKANVEIPTAVASGPDKPSFFAVTLNASQAGEFEGMKIERNGNPSWLESGDIEHSLKHLSEKLQEFVEQVQGKSDGTTQEIEIELRSRDNLSAKTFLQVCGKLHSLAETHGNSESMSIRLWPMGFPRESPVEMEMPIDFAPVEID